MSEHGYEDYGYDDPSAADFASGGYDEYDPQEIANAAAQRLVRAMAPIIQQQQTQLNQLIGNAAYQQSHYQRQEAGWTNGRMQALPGVPKRAEGTVLGINNRGQIIGDVQKIGRSSGPLRRGSHIGADIRGQERVRGRDEPTLDHPMLAPSQSRSNAANATGTCRRRISIRSHTSGKSGAPSGTNATSSPSRVDSSGMSPNSGTSSVMAQPRRLRTRRPPSVDTSARKPSHLTS